MLSVNKIEVAHFINDTEIRVQVSLRREFFLSRRCVYVRVRVYVLVYACACVCIMCTI